MARKREDLGAFGFRVSSHILRERGATLRCIVDCMPAVDGDVGISLCWVLGGRSF